MKPMGSQIKVSPSGLAFVHGVDYGAPMTFVQEKDGILVFKVPGHRRWSGIGQTTYEEPRFVIFRCISSREVGGVRTFEVEGLTEIKTGRSMKRP